MTDKKFTDEEIIKALEYCNAGRTDCDKCVVKRKCESYPFHSAVAEYALDLINRQKSEIERLENALLALMNYLNIIGCDKSDVSFIKIATDLNKQIRADIKSQSVKDFAKRLKKETLSDRGYDILQQGTIDNILKEMVGEEE